MFVISSCLQLNTGVRTESVNTMTIFFCRFTFKSIKLYKYMIRSECLNSINVMSMSF